MPFSPPPPRPTSLPSRVATASAYGVDDADRRDDLEAAAQTVRVHIADAELCPRYTASIIRGVTIGPSPAWLAERITATVGGVDQAEARRLLDLTGNDVKTAIVMARLGVSKEKAAARIKKARGFLKNILG